MGRDFVDLFVDEDEKNAARVDQLKIIDEDEVFHNIANDHGRDGNILHLITNCRRIYVEEKGEYWNAEMGLIIDYFNEEQDRLNQIINESRKVKSCVSKFISDVKQDKEQFAERKKALFSSIRKYEGIAITRGRRGDFQKKISAVRASINQIDEQLKNLIERNLECICQSLSFEEFEENRIKYKNENDELMDHFDEVVLDVEDIAREFDDSSNIISLKNNVMNYLRDKISDLTNKAHELSLKAGSEVDEYRRLNVCENAERMKMLTERYERLTKLEDDISNYSFDSFKKLSSAESEEKINEIKNQIDKEVSAFDAEIKKIKEEMG